MSDRNKTWAEEFIKQVVSGNGALVPTASSLIAFPLNVKQLTLRQHELELAEAEWWHSLAHHGKHPKHDCCHGCARIIAARATLERLHAEAE